MHNLQNVWKVHQSAVIAKEFKKKALNEIL